MFVNPYLEISTTHLFNPDWSGHARLHNAWQLISNFSFSVFAVWLVWKNDSPILASVVALIISVSFLVGYIFRNIFGGTMQYADGSELLIFGVNPAVGCLVFVTLGLLTSLALNSTKN